MYGTVILKGGAQSILNGRATNLVSSATNVHSISARQSEKDGVYYFVEVRMMGLEGRASNARRSLFQMEV